jgi:outer membrane receptor protein involved in Fe transport
MKKYIFILLIALSATIAFAARGGAIQGLVTDLAYNTELSGTSIRLADGNRLTFTNELGVFMFNDLADGTYQLEVNCLGYEKQIITAIVRNHESSFLKISLRAAPVLIKDVQISAQNRQFQQTLTALDVHFRPLQSSQDVLRAVPGLVIAQHAGGGKAEQIFLRGFDIDHGTDIAIFADDMPVNMVSHAHGQGYADLHFVIPELIEKVDFEKGAYNAQVGNFATAGFVKFQTPDVLRESFVKLEAGDFGNLRVATAVDLLGKKAAEKGSSAYIALESMLTRGYFEANQDFKRTNLFGKYRYAPNEKQALTASFSTFSSSWLASGQIPDRAVQAEDITWFGSIDSTEGGRTSRTNLNLKHTLAYNDNTLIKNQLYFSDYNFELYSNFTFFLRDAENGDQIRQKEQRKMFGYNTAIEKNYTLFDRELRWKTGLNLRGDQTKNSELSYTRQRTETLQNVALGDVAEVNVAAYTEANWAVTDRLTAVAGLRYDYFNFLYHNQLDTAKQAFFQTAKGILNPKINLLYQISPRIKVFFQAGGGLHSNDTRVIAQGTTNNILPRATGLDAGIFFKPSPQMLLSVSVWQLGLQQEFVYVGDEGIVEAGGRTLRRGIDISLRWQLAKWLYLDGDVNFTRPRALDVEEGQYYIPLAPVRTAVGGLQAEKGAWKAGLRTRYVGDRAANEDYSLTAEGYLLLDAMLSCKPAIKGKRPLEIAFFAQNLTNTRWKEAQFETETRLRDEINPVSEIHFTPGTPFFLKGAVTVNF